MAVLNSSVHFLAGIALYMGAPLSLRSLLNTPSSAKQRRRTAARRYPKTPLSAAEKQELLASIRTDDWLE